MSIDRIGLSSFSSVGAGQKPSVKKDDKKKADEKEIQQTPAGKQIAPEKVMNFMAAKAGIDINSSSIDKALAMAAAAPQDVHDRIAGFVKGFEDAVAGNLKAISKEFPEMSAPAREAAALKMVKE